MYNLLNNFDEFEYFQKFISGIKERNPEFLQNLILSLNEETRNSLKDLFYSKRVLINEKDNVTVPRKILKVHGIKKI